MRIERIELDGFGRFHEAAWPLEDGMTVLVGANEAGKTTLLNGLRALLFGFEPTRDGRTWYPAFAGGRRGGRLVLRTAGDERWTIERHGDKGGGGSLAVRAPNGNQGGQETLDRLLRGADRDLFNNIFAFGLSELQTLASLNADGVRGRIYGAGTGLGGTSAVDLERRLRQQLDATFLPRGSQKPLNALLGRIDDIRREIADLARQPEEHEDAHREREAHRTRVESLRNDIRGRRELSARYGRLRAAGPIAAELAEVQAELDSGDAVLDAIPEDVVAVLDRRSGELAEARATLAALDEQLAEARGSREGLEIDERLLAMADELTAIVEEHATRAATGGQRRDLDAAEARSGAAVAEQLSRAGGWTEERLLALDDSIPAVEATRVHERDLQATRATAAEAEQRRRSAADELELREREGGLESEDDDAALEERADALRKLDALRIRTAAAEAVAARGGPRIRLSPVVVMVAAGGLLLGGWLVGTLLTATLPGLAVGALAGAVLILLARGTGASGTDLAGLDVERRALLGVLGLDPHASDAEIHARHEALAGVRARRQVAQEQHSSLEARRVEVERRTRDASAAEKQAAEAGAAWAAWLEQHGLSDGLTPDAARQLLAAAGMARRAALERDGHRIRLAELATADAAYAARADALLTSAGTASPGDAARRDALVIGLGTKLDSVREQRRRAAELDATIARLSIRRAPALKNVTEREAAVAAHLVAQGCEDPDGLRRRAAEAASRREFQGRARELRARMAGIAGGPDAIGPLLADSASTDPDRLEADRAEAEEDLERLEIEERDALNRIGALDARIAQLEATEELGTRRQELAVLEGQAAAMAREWAVRALALRLLEETRSRYERERQPDVVRAAEQHFERITGGRYARIVAPPGDASVRVETEGGEGRITDELSRGTAEQLYLALRFGLIEEFARHAEPLPVVMDDILVNFDADRAARAAAAIRDLAARHQVLYFTCHPWTAELLDPDGGRTLTLD